MTTDAYKVGDISALFSSSATNNNNGLSSSSSTFTEQIFGTKAQPVKPQEKLSSNALKQLSSPAPAPAAAKKSGAAAQKRKRNNKSDKNTQNKKQKSTEKSAETTSTTAEEANAATTTNNDNSSNENNEQQTEENTNEDNNTEKSQFRETRDLKKQKKKEMDERRYIKKADFSDRTLFVGNFPILDKKVKKAQKQIRNLFEPFGKVETVRVRNIAVRDAKTQNRKIALVSHSSNMKQKPFANAYVVFAVPLSKTNDHPREEEEAPEKVVTEEEAATEKVVVEKTATEAPAAVMMTDEQAVIMRQQMENAVKSLNATVFEGRHLIVDFVTNYDGSFTEHKQLTRRDHGRSVFLGNLPFEIDDEDVWSLFEKRMGLKVDRVRIVRDAETQRSRGFGFVMFRDEDDASLACTKSEHFRLGENMIRITRSNSAAMKVKEAKKKREEAKKERANKQSFRDKNMKKPAAAKAMIEAEASTSANPYAGMRADKKTFLERKDKSKQLKQKITKQNKMKQIKAKKGLLKK